jgi:hypothetical protein
VSIYRELHLGQKPRMGIKAWFDQLCGDPDLWIEDCTNTGIDEPRLDSLAFPKFLTQLQESQISYPSHCMVPGLNQNKYQNYPI